MTVPSLSQIGRALYGDRWAGPLASALNVHPRTLARWELGQRPIPPGVWAECVALLKARRIAIADICGDLPESKQG